MKLKRKLIGLSLLVSALTSFCAFGSVSEAKKRVKKNVSVQTNQMNTKKRVKKNKKNVSVQTNQMNNKVFGAYVEEGESLSDNVIHLAFSPGFLKQYYDFDLDCEKMNLKIVDSQGLAFKLTRKAVPLPSIVKECDAIFLFGLGVKNYDDTLYDNYIESYHVDEGFNFVPDKKYSIEIYDSKGRLVVKDRVTPKNYVDENGRIRSFNKLKREVAHFVR